MFSFFFFFYKLYILLGYLKKNYNHGNKDQKNENWHHLLNIMSFQTCMNFFFP